MTRLNISIQRLEHAAHEVRLNFNADGPDYTRINQMVVRHIIEDLQRMRDEWERSQEHFRKVG